MKTYVAIANVLFFNDDEKRELIFYAGNNLIKAQKSFDTPDGLDLTNAEVYFKTIQLWENHKFIRNL